jgi:hypothetical protein
LENDAGSYSCLPCICNEKLQNYTYQLYYVCPSTSNFRTCEQTFTKSDTKELHTFQCCLKSDSSNRACASMHMSRAADEMFSKRCKGKQNIHFIYNSLLTVHSKQLYTAQYEELPITIGHMRAQTRA